MTTSPDVFIIESLHPEDEGNGRFEGHIISHILRLHGKKPIYKYVRTSEDFKAGLHEFEDSNYRYLHISAHGNKKGMCTTNDDNIDYGGLAGLLKSSLKKKRLFLSACSMVNKDMAESIIPRTKCLSVVGPIGEIEFSVAAVLWPAIYHLMFDNNDSLMKNKELKKNLKKVASLFKADIGYCHYSKKSASIRVDRLPRLN